MNEYKSLKSDIRKGYEKAWDDEMAEYCTGKANFATRLSDGSIFVIEKPQMRKDFCFGESGYDADEAYSMANVARTSEDYFRQENLKDLDDIIEVLEGKNTDGRKPYLDAETYGDIQTGINELTIRRWYQVDDDPRYQRGEVRQMTDEERDVVLGLYKEAREDFLKKINRYLKRYGLSKVRAWTYWRDE